MIKYIQKYVQFIIRLQKSMFRVEWFIKNPTGIFTVSLTYILILYSFFTYIICLDFWHVGYWFMLLDPLIILWTFLAIWTHLKCMLTNPVIFK